MATLISLNRYWLLSPWGCLSHVRVSRTPSTTNPSTNSYIYQAASKQELGRHIGFNGPDAQTAFLKKLYFGGLVATLAIGITRLSIFVSYRRMFSSSSQTMEVILLIIAGIVTCGGIGFVSSDLKALYEIFANLSSSKLIR
jgi:hypothetical protein